ncbi:hypothetical protein BH11BAC7_BH11BAC7_21740 [soil metagenome]
MNNINCIDLSVIISENFPFPHFYSPSALLNGFEKKVFKWFEETNEWYLIETDFYEQYEFNFLSAKLPHDLECLIGEKIITTIKSKLKDKFNVSSLNLVGITAHKLINGHRIGIHNDFINGDETHRLVIHINPNWNESNGGLLMLFSSSNADDLTKIVKPINNSAFAFEISGKSHHAVSKIHNFSRYTVVYTFKAG